LEIEKKIEASLIFLKKKVSSMIKKLKNLSANRYRAVKAKKDPLSFMTKTKLKVENLIEDVNNFLGSLHKENRFESIQCQSRNSTKTEKSFVNFKIPSKKFCE
jgi:hypothetical protein